MSEAPSKGNAFRRHLTELVVVFVGVALAFAVENLREDLNERAVGAEYLSSFRQDLSTDLEMLQAELEFRRDQRQLSETLLEFFEGRPSDPQAFFGAYWTAIQSRKTIPHRNTMDEVLSSGSLRLIRDPEIRSRLLTLYAGYDGIAFLEDHMVRDFEAYLYDPSFTTIPAHFIGPWEDTPANRNAVETLLGDIRVENGIRLIVANLGLEESGLIGQLADVRTQVEELLELIPE